MNQKGQDTNAATVYMLPQPVQEQQQQIDPSIALEEMIQGQGVQAQPIASKRQQVHVTALQQLRRSALQPDFQAAIAKEKYREPTKRRDKVQPSVQQMSNVFQKFLGSDNFFNDLSTNNSDLFQLIRSSMNYRDAGGYDRISITMPKNDTQFSSAHQQAIKIARRILRTLRGALQARGLQPKKYNSQYLQAKMLLAQHKKAGDPHGFVVQLKNYISKYNSASPAVIMQKSSTNVNTGLQRVATKIGQKVQLGLQRLQNIGNVSKRQLDDIEAEKRQLRTMETALGIQTSAAKPQMDLTHVQALNLE